MSLYHLLQQLSSTQMTFIFPKSHNYYYLTLQHFEVRLIIESKHQLLIGIEIMNLQRVPLTYQGHLLKDYKFQTVYDHYFGPTYPGELYDAHYILNYPGISFRFDLEESTDDLKRVMELNPRVHSLIIHQFDKWSDLEAVGYTTDAVNRVAVDDIEIYDLEVSDSKRHTWIKINFFKHQRLTSYQLTIDESLQQDILAELGPPDEVYLKNDSRSLIHGKHQDQTTCVFHNYFRYGFDLLYTMTKSGGVLTKVILHCNLPNSVLFGKYRKCVWTYGKYFSETDVNELYDTENQVVINRNDSMNQSLEFLDGSERNENEIDWGKSIVITSKRDVKEFVKGRINALTLF
jgi:hypothetical protein